MSSHNENSIPAAACATNPEGFEPSTFGSGGQGEPEAVGGSDAAGVHAVTTDPSDGRRGCWCSSCFLSSGRCTGFVGWSDGVWVMDEDGNLRRLER